MYLAFFHVYLKTDFFITQLIFYYVITQINKGYVDLLALSLGPSAGIWMDGH